MQSRRQCDMITAYPDFLGLVSVIRLHLCYQIKQTGNHLLAQGHSPLPHRAPLGASDAPAGGSPGLLHGNWHCHHLGMWNIHPQASTLSPYHAVMGFCWHPLSASPTDTGLTHRLQQQAVLQASCSQGQQLLPRSFPLALLLTEVPY